MNRLDCNTRYDFQALARGDGSTYSLTYVDPSSSVSETTAACVAPATTVPGITSDTEDSVILSWNVETDTTSYKVEFRMTRLHGLVPPPLGVLKDVLYGGLVGRQHERWLSPGNRITNCGWYVRNVLLPAARRSQDGSATPHPLFFAAAGIQSPLSQ